MEVKLHNTIVFEDVQSLNDTEKYFLVSMRWSLISEEHITFVRQGAMAYCYNLKWAGPLTEVEAAERCIKGKMLMVPFSLIKSYLVQTKIDEVDCLTLPNTAEVRRMIGFNDVVFQLVI